MFKKIRIAIIIISLGICTGLAVHYLLNKETGILVKQPLVVTLPEEGIKTDAFGIRLLQAAMKQEPGESVLVAPALTGEALLQLRELAADSTRQDIDKLGIVFPEKQHTAQPLYNVVMAADYGLHYTESVESESVIRLPFRADRPLAMSLFNGMLAEGIQEMTGPIISSKLLIGNTKFIIGGCCEFIPEFEPFFRSEHTIAAEFENANGSLPQVNMMRLRANVRYVKDDTGEWEAVALMLAPTASRKGEPTVWIGILPAKQAAAMATQLDMQQLHSIRKKLAEATPVDCCVSLPRLFWAPPARNLQPLLEELGLGSLFIESKNWKFTDSKLKLDAMPEKISISFIPRPGDNAPSARPENAPASISFNRPFIWLISDLTTAAPPYFIGLVQNL